MGRTGNPKGLIFNRKPLGDATVVANPKKTKWGSKGEKGSAVVKEQKTSKKKRRR